MPDDTKEMQRPKRISLTKKQRQSEIGAELLSLSQTVTADGSLSPEEILALRDWLTENRDADLPAISHLTGVVEKIIADRRVTLEERRELFIAIETVLPPDIRSIAKTARRSLEEKEQARLRLQHEVEKQRLREERERDDPIEHWDFMVAGSRYDGRPGIIKQYARAGDSAWLVRDRVNKFSRNAVEVRTANGHQIGYVPEEDAIDLAPLLDAGHPYSAEIKKILTGGRFPIPVIIAELYRKDASVPTLVQPGTEPPRAIPDTYRASETTFGVKTILGLVILAGMLVMLIKSCS